jgi:heme A synthase
MEREVDRLLAGLSTFGSQPRRDHEAPVGSRDPAASDRRRTPRPARPAVIPTRGDHVALWARLLLGVALGVAMTQWPYPHGCGVPLSGYLGAVAMVVLAGAWIAVSSWKLRVGVVHTLALLLLFWGIVLAAERALPRVGYAAERATWRC